MSREQTLLRRQLLWWLLIPLSLLLAADGFFSYWVAVYFSQRANDRTLVEIARDVSLHLRGVDGQLSLDLPDASRQLLFADDTDRIVFEVATIEGQHIDGTNIVPPAAPYTAFPSPIGADILYDGELSGTPVRIVQRTVAASAALGRSGALVRIAETKNKRNELTRELLASLMLPQMLLILITGLLVQAGVARGLAPLERVRQSVASRPPNDHSPVSISGVPGEVRPLLQSINNLLSSLDATRTLQSRFISDAAHQLKTPLAVLETQLALALRESETTRMREALKILHQGLERLSRVVNQILALARNESEAVSKLTLTRLDLNALVLDICTHWVSEALKKDIDFGFEGCNSPVFVEGDALRLRELVDNLVDNAIRYSRNGGRVTVCVSGGSTPTLAVSDDSPTIPAHERERVFERFHRLLGNAAAGSGLGLAIVKEIVQLHGATVDLLDDPDGTGHTFRVSFPPKVNPVEAA